MRAIEVESWALRVLASIQAGQPFEDARVELKAMFPSDAQKAARRIAAHANSAMSEPILWLVGVDQKSGVIGTNPADLANWFAGVKACFDGVSPALSDLVIPFGKVVIQALQFTTDRAPYLVKNPEGGTIQREIPWREGTTTRTATREEVLRVLQPDLPIPEFEVLAADAQSAPAEGDYTPIFASMEIYIVPVDGTRAVFPFHRCSGKIILQGKIVAENLTITAREHSLLSGVHRAIVRRASSAPVVNVHGAFKSIEYEEHQIVVNRPSRVRLTMTSGIVAVKWKEISALTLEITLGLANGHGRTCVVGAHLAKRVLSDDGESTREWRL